MSWKFNKYLLAGVVVCGILATLGFKPYGDNKAFESAVSDIAKGFDNEDSILINSYIDSSIGVYILYRIGVPNIYTQTNKIDFSQPIPEYLPYFSAQLDGKVRYETLPEYDCDMERWSKTGIYCDTTSIDTLLSATARLMVQYDLQEIPDNEIHRIINIEKDSRRVVITDEDGGELVFYLTLINGKWRLTIIDRVTSDCSA